MRLLWISTLLMVLLLPVSAVYGQNTCRLVVGTGADIFVPVYDAPLNHAAQQINLLAQNSVNTVTQRYGRFFYLVSSSGAPVGWVHSMAVGALTEGDCSAVPENTTPLVMFKEICFFSSTQALPLKVSPTATESRGTTSAGGQYAVVQQLDSYFYIVIDDASGGWVASAQGSITGGCNDIPRGLLTNSVKVLANARIWSTPDVRTARVVRELPVGTSVVIVGGPMRGPVQANDPNWGNWYLISLSQSEPPLGWLWEGRLDITVTGQPKAIALADARLWTVPDVRNGTVIGTIPAGQAVTILGSPTSGVVRADTGATGNWYYVQANGLTGWVWEGRLEFRE